MNKLGGLIKETRKNKGLTTTELAKRIDVTQGYISHLENHRKKQPSHEILKKLADTLDIDFLDIMLAAGYITEQDMTSTPEEDILFEFKFFLQYKKQLEHFEEQSDPILTKEKLTSRMEKQRNTVLNYMIDELNLETIFNSNLNINIGGNILSSQQKEKALKILKATFVE